MKHTLENLFTEFTDVIFNISEIYRFEGRFNEATTLFESIKSLLDSGELRKENKARILIQFAKIKMDHKFLKDFNYDEEMKMLQDAQKLAESSNAKDIQADALDLYGNCIYRIGILEGDFEGALKYYEKALSLRTQINNKLGISKSFFHIGVYHENKKDADEKDYETSFEYYNNGLKIALEEDFKLEQSYFYRHLAGHYQFLWGDLDKALEYHKKSAELREEIGFIFSLQFAYFAIGLVYFMKNDLENTLDYLEKAYSAAEKVNRIKPLMVLIRRRGEGVVKEMGVDTAINYYNLILQVVNNINNLEAVEEFKLKLQELSKKE